MTLFLRDQENRDLGREEGLEQGLEQGLSALVNSLKLFLKSEEELYRTVVNNEAYKNTSREEVLKYL